MPSKISLPIDDSLPALLAELANSASVVLEAPPGAGKTTRVPSALLDAEFLQGKEVWVLEPRRLAARMAARRIAEERGERLGATVGYQIRFEEVASPQTRLRLLTEGVLTRRLLTDQRLAQVGAVILDEFHERHLQTDLALVLLRQLQQTTRPDLKLVVMSATLDAAPVAEYLQAPRLRSEGQRFDVALEFAAHESQAPLAEQVAAAVQRLLQEKLVGDVLVFLPGAAEIRKAQAACAPLARQHDLLVLPLHGDLNAAEQDRAVQPAAQRKIILATNVAESSLTIEGVAAVIDSGLARIAGHSPWSGLSTLNVQRVSQAAAIQRAGRAGRTRAGRCLRLYTQQDFNARPAFETPEIQRLDLTEAALALHASGIRDLAQFNWFAAPPAPALVAADDLLRKLGALTDAGALTASGQQMLRYPVHPRQARILLAAQQRSAAPAVNQAACTMVALLGERDIVASGAWQNERQVKQAHANAVGPSDLLDRLDRFAEAERVNFAPERLREFGLELGATLAVERVRQQLLAVQRRMNKADAPVAPAAADIDLDELLQFALLAGYPDRVARRRSFSQAGSQAGQAEKGELLLSGGGAAVLAQTSVVWQSEFLVALAAEERRDLPANRNRLVRLASEIKVEWLIDLFADALTETTDARWNAEHERVEIFERMLYDQLVISETRQPRPRDQQARATVARVLAEAALAAGLQRFADPERIANFRHRVAFLARAFPETDFPVFDEAAVQAALTALCDGLRSFAELRAAAEGGGLLEMLKAQLNSEQLRLLAQHAPETINLAGRRNVRINYEANQAPWIASRLQDFFGMTASPTLAQGRVALVLHLLAPNQRPVQVTSDLAGFWTRHYPAIRKELSRRYPRHAWPDNPHETVARKQ